MSESDKLLYPDELADALRRGRCYIYAMKKAGFSMPGGTATLTEARDWLRQNSNFKTTGYFKKSEVETVAAIDVDFSN